MESVRRYGLKHLHKRIFSLQMDEVPQPATSTLIDPTLSVNAKDKQLDALSGFFDTRGWELLSR